MNQVLRIPEPPNFSFQECLWFLDRNYDDCLHEIAPDYVIKAIEPEGYASLIKVSSQEDMLVIEPLEGDQSPSDILIAYIREWFDLDRDLHPFYQLLNEDEDLAFMAEKYRGLRLMGIPDLFEALCWSIIGQQINLTFAYKLKRRLVEACGPSLNYQGKNYFFFPEPQVLSQMPIDELRTMQFSGRKSEYLIQLAQLFASGELNKEKLSSLSGPEAMGQKLMEIKGIGPWTANYALMKSLRVQSSIPYGDVGLNQALHQRKGFDKRPTKVQIDAFFDQFAGWQSYLVFYLWRSLS